MNEDTGTCMTPEQAMRAENAELRAENERLQRLLDREAGNLSLAADACVACLHQHLVGLDAWVRRCAQANVAIIVENGRFHVRRSSLSCAAIVSRVGRVSYPASLRQVRNLPYRSMTQTPPL